VGAGEQALVLRPLADYFVVGQRQNKVKFHAGMQQRANIFEKEREEREIEGGR
jgi:hypothetical protein